MGPQHAGMETSAQQRVGTPWHLWFAAVIFILLYGVGAYDYVMILGQNLSGYGEAVAAYFTDYPLWLSVVWGVNISAGLMAPILLLFRSRYAVPLALVSAAALLLQQVSTFGFRERWQALGPGVSLFDIAILLLTFGLFVYSREMARRGVLR